MDSKICFEMSLFVVEAIRGRCASFMILTAKVSEICGGQTNVPILVDTVEPVLGDPWFGRPLVLGDHYYRHGSFLTIKYLA